MNRVKAVEKDKDELEEAKNEAVEFLTIENNIVKLKNKLFQKYMYVNKAFLLFFKTHFGLIFNIITGEIEKNVYCFKKEKTQYL